MQISVLLSIRPEFAKRIFEGTKQFEFRKKVFSNRDVKKIVVYVTAPVKKVVGEFEIETIIKSEVAQLWEQTKEHSGIPKGFFDDYFDGREIGYAIKIGKTQKYEEPLDLQKHFNVKCAPQSFVYLSEDALSSA